MRIIAILFVLMFFVVGVGFWYQARHFPERHETSQRDPYERPAKGMFRASEAVHLSQPVYVCKTAEDCGEARDMQRRMTLGNPARGDIRLGKEWFEFREDSIRSASDLVILEPGPNYTRVRITSGPDSGFEGYVFTVSLEEAATSGDDVTGQANDDLPPKS